MALDPKKKKILIITLVVVIILAILLVIIAKRRKSSGVTAETGGKTGGDNKPVPPVRAGGQAPAPALDQGWKVGDKVYVKPGATTYGQFGIYGGPNSGTLVGILNEEWYANNKLVGTVNAIEPFAEPELSGGFLRVTLPAGTVYYIPGRIGVEWGKKTTPMNFDGWGITKNAQRLGNAYGNYYVRANEMKR